MGTSRISRRLLTTAACATALHALGCETVLPLAGYPKKAMRSAPPKGIEQQAESTAATAPGLTLATTGGPVVLSESESPVALFFFRGHWCPYCRSQLKDFNDALGSLDEAGVTLIGISADNPKDTHALKHRLSLNYSLANDEKLEAIQAFGVLDADNEIAWPALFLIVEGKIAYRWLAEDKAKRKPVAEIIGEIRAAIID